MEKSKTKKTKDKKEKKRTSQYLLGGLHLKCVEASVDRRMKESWMLLGYGPISSSTPGVLKDISNTYHVCKNVLRIINKTIVSIHC